MEGVARSRVLSDALWRRIESLMPAPSVKGGRPFQDHRRVVEGIIWRYRTGTPWRDVPAEFGPWRTLWKRHRRFSEDGTWDRIRAELLTAADAAGELVWAVSVDSTIDLAHQPPGHGGTCRTTTICRRGQTRSRSRTLLEPPRRTRRRQMWSLWPRR